MGPEEPLKRIRSVVGDASNSHLLQRQGGPFDAVLVDAPCSSERERLLREAGLARWDYRKAHTNARRQVGLLQAAMDIAPRGQVVYSTCALPRVENDDVIAEALRMAPPGWSCKSGSHSG